MRDAVSAIEETGRALKRVHLLGQSIESGNRRRRVQSPLPVASGSLSTQIPFAPDVDWPLGPAVEQVILTTLREAISIGMSIAEITEQLTDVLGRFEIELPPDDLRSIVGAHVIGAA